jgi:hypothetical protein
MLYMLQASKGYHCRIDKTWTFHSHSSRIIELFGFGPTLPASSSLAQMVQKGQKVEHQRTVSLTYV